MAHPKRHAAPSCMQSMTRAIVLHACSDSAWPTAAYHTFNDEWHAAEHTLSWLGSKVPGLYPCFQVTSCISCAPKQMSCFMRACRWQRCGGSCQSGMQRGSRKGGNKHASAKHAQQRLLGLAPQWLLRSQSR